MIRTKALIKNKWTGDSFSLSIPRGIRDKSDLIITAIVEEEDGSPEESPLPMAFLFSLRKEIHSAMVMLEKAGVRSDLRKIVGLLENGEKRCERCGGWLLFQQEHGSGPSPSESASPPPSSSPWERGEI